MTLSTAASRPVLRGVIFDMDGTLTKPNLDFKLMYERCGVPMSDDLLDAIAKMPAKEAAAAGMVIDEMEAEGRRTLELHAGAAECARWLQQHEIPMALVTRNTQETVAHLHSALWHSAGLKAFDPAISRDDDALPAKPNPAALHAIAKAWGVADASELLMVGDSPANDIGFGKAAGVATALVDSGRRYTEGGADGGADFCVENLALLPQLLWNSFEVRTTVLPASTKFAAPSPETAAARAAVSSDVGTLATLPLSSLDAPDASGNTPLIWAADAGSQASISSLLARGVDINTRGFLGATAVSRAARSGHSTALAQLLAAPGVDADMPNDKMQSPLHFAAFKRHIQCVQLLLQRGANTLVLDRKGRTPAEDTSDEEIRRVILKCRTAQMCGSHS